VADSFVMPEVADDSGYRITTQDLAYLGISSESLDEWRAGRRPLGFSDITYPAFCARLWEALAADGIAPHKVDVRLKGSASSFFSGLHKSLPTRREDTIALFRASRGRFPELFEVLEIERRLDARWPIPARPLRRPFDSMHRLGIDRVPSDYDLQISSDAIVDKCEVTAKALDISVTREVTFNHAYDFIRKDLLRASMRHLSEFATVMSDALQRDVAVAVFGFGGPPNKSAAIGELSAHFRDSDWRIPAPGGDQGAVE
jgi:hypothetical protein